MTTDEYKFRNKEGKPVYWSKLLGLGQRIVADDYEVRTSIECISDDVTGWELGGVPARWPQEFECCKSNGITHFPDGTAVAEDYPEEAAL